MLQRLEEVKKYSKFGIFSKKKKMNLVKEETHEIHIGKEKGDNVSLKSEKFPQETEQNSPTCREQ